MQWQTGVAAEERWRIPAREYWQGHVKEPQRQTYRLIWLIWGEYDARERAGQYPPTVRELAALARARLGLKASSTTYRALRIMERLGLLENASDVTSRGRRLKVPFNQWLGS
jgi:hypothetical protein